MKKKAVVIGLIVFCALGAGCMMLNTTSAFAQEAEAEAAPRERMEDRWGRENVSELYYVNLPIEKVYNYRLGYVVLYRKGVNELGRAYIPFTWFRSDSRKAELIELGDGKVWPCMSVFYKAGAFHTVRLYVARKDSHLSWGTMPSNVNIDDRFEGVETIDISSNAEAEQ